MATLLRSRFTRIFRPLSEAIPVHESPSRGALEKRVNQGSDGPVRLGRKERSRMTFSGTTTATRWQPFTYRDQSWQGTDLTGFKIEALDGDIGAVDEATHEIDSSYLIV